jgi:hypothetical protein
MDLSRWDVTNVADKRSMFEEATDFVGDVTAWNISDEDTMDSMDY